MQGPIRKVTALLFIAVSFFLVTCKKDNPVIPVIDFVKIGNVPPGETIGYSHTVTFFDENRGVLYGDNRFLITQDGGKTWTIPMQLPTAYTFSGVSIVESTLYAFLSGQANYGILYKSTDYGLTWQLVTYGTFGVKSMMFSHTDGMTEALNGNQWQLKYTYDGGVTWYVKTLPQIYLVDYHFYDPFNGYIIISGPIKCYLTSDGGVTWTPQTTAVRAANIEQSGFRTLHAHGHFWTAGITYTDNRGLSWTEAAFETTFKERPKRIDDVSISPDGSIGCAIGENAIYLSTDRGTSWKFHLYKSGTTAYPYTLRKVKAIPGNKLLAFAADGSVYEIIRKDEK